MTASEPQSNPQESRIFEIKDCALLAIATGSRAVNLKELRDILSTISLDSVYYHFWGGLLQPRFEEREYNNDFAAWAWHGLHDGILAERLAVVDPTEFKDLEDLRQELLEIIEERMDEQVYLSMLYASSGFEFIRSQIVVFDTQKRAQTPAELAELLPTLSTGSIFYHFIDARRRLPHHGNDFSFWLIGCEPRYQDLCAKLNGIDPYFGNLSQIKEQLGKIFQQFFAQEGI
jgi:hypothetical protein